MPYVHDADPDLDRSTTRVMAWAVVLTLAMVAAFPLYLWYEPDAREDNRAAQLSSLASEGESLWGFNCAACHGTNGQGASAPALNTRQFLRSVDDDQVAQLIEVGIPGSEMSAYSQDFAGPLTSEQIRALTTFIRTWEENAPDNPNWRTPRGVASLSGRELYESSCASCHAADLTGVDDYPDLSRGSDAAEDSDARLARQIVEGEDEMPAFGDTFTEDQIEAIIAYLREVQAREA